MDQKQYILNLMIGAYNRQFRKRFNISDFDLMSITPRVKYRFGYEAFTTRTDDNFRLRAYFNFGDYDYSTLYRLESDGSGGSGNLSDEVFVCTGTLDRYFFEQGLVKFKFIPPPTNNAPTEILLMENGDPLLAEDGDYILLETA